MEKHNHRLSIRLNDKEYKEISFYADAFDGSRGKFIRFLIKLYAKIKIPKFRDSFFKYLESPHKKSKINDYRALNKLDAIYPVLYRTSSNLDQIARAEHLKENPSIDLQTVSGLKRSLDKTYSIVKEVLK